MAAIRKEVFLVGMECARKGWNLQNGVDAKTPNAGEQFRMRQGIEIGERARKLYPDGMLIKISSTEEAARQTAELSARSDVRTIFEASAFSGSLVARVDVLTRTNGGWHLLEVKSSISEKKEHLDDAAYTCMVLRSAGYEIKAVSLLLLSKEYRLGDADEALFVEVERTDEILERSEALQTIAHELAAVISADNLPEAEFQFRCRDCIYFESSCVGAGVDGPIFCLPRLSKTKFDVLWAEGVMRVADVPEGFKLTPNQQRVYEVMKNREEWVSDELGVTLDQVEWPAYYLDFESTMTALPLYPGLAPHEAIPTQYSIHMLEASGGNMMHKEFLGNPQSDPRRALAENLVRDLGDRGSILVYSAYESRMIKILKTEFDDLALPLGAILERLYDLEAVIRKHYCHPGFQGRTSIKKTLPVMVPALSYEGLEVADGDTAAALFAEMAQGRYTESECAEIREDLLAYCKMDTLGMVEIYEVLRGISTL